MWAVPTAAKAVREMGKGYLNFLKTSTNSSSNFFCESRRQLSSKRRSRKVAASSKSRPVGLASACVVQAPAKPSSLRNSASLSTDCLTYNLSPTGRGSLAFLGRVDEGVSPRLCLFDARADHLCLDALKVVLRSFNGVNVDEESGVVVARRGVTDGAIVTLGRVELRLVDAWDWALALSGIFVARAALRGPRCSKAF